MRNAYRDIYPEKDLQDLFAIGASAEEMLRQTKESLWKGKFWRVVAYGQHLVDVACEFIDIFRDDHSIFCSLGWLRFNPEQCLLASRIIRTYTPFSERSDEMLNLVMEIAEHGIRQNPDRVTKLLLAEQLLLASKEWQDVRGENASPQVEMLKTLRASF